MAAKKGRGLLMVYSDVAPENDAEYNRWYNEEHIPERLSIPGVLSAARYQAVQGGPKYLACYELDQPETYQSDAWQSWLKNPTEWTKRMSPDVIGTERGNGGEVNQGYAPMRAGCPGASTRCASTDPCTEI